MSKQQKNTTGRSKQTDEASIEEAQPSIDIVEFEQQLHNFNTESLKHDICRQIKAFQDLIVEEEISVEDQAKAAEASPESVASSSKVQRITLPESKKVIQGRKNSLRQACELVEAWLKSAKTAPFAASDEALMVDQMASSIEEQARPSTFSAIQQLPVFTNEEIYSKRFFQASEEIHIFIKGNEWSGLEGLSRLVLLQALAQLDPESCDTIDKNDIKIEMTEQPPFSCILDGVQFVQINQSPNWLADAAAGANQSVRSSMESAEQQKQNPVIQLKFHYTRRMANTLREEAENEERIRREKEAIILAEEEAHRRKYAIVDKIRQEMAIKDGTTNLSLVDKYAKEAQAEFEMVSMKDVAASGNFSCPKKYLNQRDQPLEVPMECVRKLCDRIDRDFDDRLTHAELLDYVREKELPIEEETVQKMFDDAIRGRGFVNERQRLAPLSHEEVADQVRGRHAWDINTKTWNIQYRPYRNEWIVLLLTVNPRIFAMPMPRVIPSKITAQYEQEEAYQQSLTMGKYGQAGGTLGSIGVGSQNFYGGSSISAGMMDSLSKTGIDRRYQSIQEIKEPNYKRDLTKNEGGIVPDRGSTIKIGGKKQKYSEPNPYETHIASRMAPADANDLPEGKKATGFPKVTFAAQQVFNEVVSLSAKVPTWTQASQNPINQFVPVAEQSYKIVSEEQLMVESMKEARNTKLSSLAGRERTLQLAGTMALKQRKMSPISKLRETRGMVTIKRVPDIDETKVALAKTEQGISARPEYVVPKDHEFKSYDTLAFGQKDFNKLAKPDGMENPHGLSEFDKRPKAIAQRVQMLEAKRIEVETVAAREKWQWSHESAPKYQPLNAKVPHLYNKKQKQEPTTDLDKEVWESSVTLLARTIADDLVVGKPKFNAMIKPLKAEDKTKGFSGNYEPYKCVE